MELHSLVVCTELHAQDNAASDTDCMFYDMYLFKVVLAFLFHFVLKLE